MPLSGYNGENERLIGVDEERLPTRTYVLALIAIVGLALILRLAGFGRIPLGLYHDEAYNGLDALEVLRGWRPLWFPANNGREPLFIYLVALSVSLLGRTVAAIRAPALVLGVLTVPATAFLGSSLFNRRVGLLAAAVTAVTFWPLHLSRIGFRAVALPFFLALALGFLWRGLRLDRRRDYAAAGLFYGIAFYTYLAARFTPLPLLLLAALLLWPAARLLQPDWRKLALFAGVALITMAPMLIYMAGHPEILAGRADQVSVFNPDISHGDPWGTLARHTGQALLAFFIRGDRIPRHNLPWRPIFDPALGLAFALGLVVAVRRRGAGWFAILWVATMLLPTILAEDSPHFLRAVGIQPLVFVLPAIGLDAAWRWLAKRGRALLGGGLAAAVLLGALASTTVAYLRDFAHSPAVYYHFEAGSTELAAHINGFLAGQPQAGSRVALISRHLWQDWPSLRFLLPEGPAVQVISVEEPPISVPSDEMLLATWPFEPYQGALSLLPGNSTVEMSADLYERGDRDPEARLLARIFQTAPNRPAERAEAVLEHGIRLVEARIEQPEGQPLRVRLVWEANEPLSVDYTASVQVLRAGAVLGQDDSPPADGALPTTRWRPGDRIVDIHEVSLPSPYDPKADQVIVGLYDFATMTRLHVKESRLPATADAIPLAVP